MTVLTIRASKRYAVRQAACVSAAGVPKRDALLIELSAEGCRVSNVGQMKLSRGDAVTIDLDRFELQAHVRWAGDGVVGLRFDRALFASELNALIDRPRPPMESAARYGT